ncbi:MAG: hypothetical protein JXP34_02785 [Planctomycetes bacterium]|nr:hypothetical protein [Planctomycetota bacterium]
MNSGLLVLAILSVAPRGADPPLVLENEHLRVEFSREDGAITRLRNKRRDLELVSIEPRTRRPWVLLLDPFHLTSEFESFRFDAGEGDPATRLVLLWRTPYDIAIRAEARLEAGSDRLELTCAAENAGKRTIIAFGYPAIQGIGSLDGDGGRDRLLHSVAMGAVFRDPSHLFQAGSRIVQGRGMVVARYPNGFHGSALQMMAYYAEGRGGFYVATEDGRCADKDFNFFKSADEGLSCQISHISGDARPGKGLAVEYPVVIAALTEGTWYEAAERYRAWATSQPWCRRGTRRERVAAGDACRWLLEDIGAVGMWWPFRQDIRKDIVRTRELFGAPLLHLELWWRHGPSREAAQSHGDRFGPFYFPFLALQGREPFRAHSQDRIVPPATPISPDWIAMCPAQPGWRTVVCESAEDMVGLGPLRHHQIWVDENGTGCAADCLYYDIGPCAGVPTHCYAQDHVHPPGAGRALTEAYVSLFRESQRRASRVKGRYVPVGTEVVSEPFVDCLDLYYPRNAGFNPDMEVLPYVRQLTWLPDGRMEIVPLFPFVYHEYGPVAVQGVHPAYPWGDADAEGFYTWAEARAFLWGGVIATFAVRADSVLSERRVRFIRSLVAARTGFARDFLAYGRMQRPPAVDCGTIEIDHGLAEGGWLRKARFSEDARNQEWIAPPPEEGEDGAARAKELSVEEWVKDMLVLDATPAKTPAIRVPSVLSQAYTREDDRLGILLVNLRADAEETVRLIIDPVSCGLPAGHYELVRVTMDGPVPQGTFRDRRELATTLPPREVILLKARRCGG